MSEDVRERLAAAYVTALGCGIECSDCADGVDALLPTVAALIREGAAEALDPLRALVDSYEVGEVVPLYRIQRAIEEADELRAASHTEATR